MIGIYAQQRFIVCPISSGQSGSYTGLIGFNPRRLKGPKRGMSSHATDLSVYAKSSSISPEVLFKVMRKQVKLGL